MLIKIDKNYLATFWMLCFSIQVFQVFFALDWDFMFEERFTQMEKFTSVGFSLNLGLKKWLETPWRIREAPIYEPAKGI